MVLASGESPGSSRIIAGKRGTIFLPAQETSSGGNGGLPLPERTQGDLTIGAVEALVIHKKGCLRGVIAVQAGLNQETSCGLWR